MSTSYTQLPTEIKLNILSQTTSSDLYQLFNTSKELQYLSNHIVQSKLHHYLSSQELLISLYSTNNKESNYKNFYSVIDLKINNNKTCFKIGNLHHKQNLLINPFEKSLPSVSEQQENHLDLVLNEDQSIIKTFFNLSLGQESIYETSIKISKLLNNGIEIQNGLKFEFFLTKGEIEPAKGGYDFDECWNYHLNFKEFEIENFKLLKILENDSNNRLIVRY